MTTPTLIALMMLGAMLIMMALRLPIAAAMAIPGAIGFGLIAGIDPLLNALKGTTVARLSVYELSIIPLFILMGQLAVHSGLSHALFKAAAAWIGHLRGGLAMASILASAVFGSICGSSVATAAPSRRWPTPRCGVTAIPIDSPQRRSLREERWEF